MLTAQQIHEKNFGKGFKGYDMDEVDAFLDEVIESFDKLSRENHEMTSRIEALNTQIESYRGMENTMMHTMVTVHKAAEEITENAKREADEVYAKARQQADEVIERATAESEQMVQSAHEESRAIVSGYQEEIRQAEEELVALNNLLEEFKSGIGHYTDELLALVEQMNTPPEVLEKVENVEAQAAQVVEVEPEPEPRVDYVGQYVSAINGNGPQEDDAYFEPVEADEDEDIDLA
jgi:cell division initiation protein